MTKPKFPPTPPRPRCGRVMQRYEAVWGPLFDDVVCGRPAGHNGNCRSVQSMAAARVRDRDPVRVKNNNRLRRERRIRARLPVGDQLAIIVADAAADARWDALGR